MFGNLGGGIFLGDKTPGALECLVFFQSHAGKTDGRPWRIGPDSRDAFDLGYLVVEVVLKFVDVGYFTLTPEVPFHSVGADFDERMVPLHFRILAQSIGQSG